MAQDYILRLPEVMARTGLGKSSIYNAIKNGSFPDRKSLGPRMVGWLSSDIDAWIQSRSVVASHPA